MSWKNSYGKSRIVDNGEHNPSDRAAFTGGKGTIKGEATVTTRSFLICQYGGLIEPITSGQEYTDSTLLTTEDAIEFGKDSDTYLILQDIQNRWNNKVDEHTLEYYQNLADEVRTAARNGTPYKYGQEKIKQIMHDNAAFITDPVLNFTNGRLAVYTLISKSQRNGKSHMSTSQIGIMDLQCNIWMKHIPRPKFSMMNAEIPLSTQ